MSSVLDETSIRTSRPGLTQQTVPSPCNDYALGMDDQQEDDVA